jgi:hypothetical protein
MEVFGMLLHQSMSPFFQPDLWPLYNMCFLRGAQQENMDIMLSFLNTQFLVETIHNIIQNHNNFMRD